MSGEGVVNELDLVRSLGGSKRGVETYGSVDGRRIDTGASITVQPFLTKRGRYKSSGLFV